MRLIDGAMCMREKMGPQHFLTDGMAWHGMAKEEDESHLRSWPLARWTFGITGCNKSTCYIHIHQFSRVGLGKHCAGMRHVYAYGSVTLALLRCISNVAVDAKTRGAVMGNSCHCNARFYFIYLPLTVDIAWEWADNSRSRGWIRPSYGRPIHIVDVLLSRMNVVDRTSFDLGLSHTH